MLKLSRVEEMQKFSRLQIQSQHKLFTVVHVDGSVSSVVDESGLILLRSRIPTPHFVRLYKITSTWYSSCFSRLHAQFNKANTHNPNQIRYIQSVSKTLTPKYGIAKELNL